MKKNLKDEIYDYLRRNNERQKEMSEQSGISQSYINRLANGQRAIEGITLDTFFKLFPAASITLTTPASADISGRQVASIVSGGDNHGSIHVESAELAVRSFKSNLMNAVLDLNLPAEELKSVLESIKNTKE